MANPIVKFGDVVHLNTDRVPDPLSAGIERYVGLEHISPGDLHLHHWGLVAEGTTFTNFFKPGQVLFGKRRAYQRKVAVADFAGVCSGDIYVFESRDPGVLLPEILPFICQTEGFFEHAVTTSAGSLSPRTNWTQLANYEFSLPPLDEQHRIANLLWAVDKNMIATEELHEKTTKAFKSTIDEFVALDTEQRKISKGAEQNELAYKHNSWISVPLREFALRRKNSFVNGPFGSDLLTNELKETGIPVIYVRDIKPNRYIRISKVHVTEKKAEQLSFCGVKYGDVLIAKVGDPPGIAAPYFESVPSIVTQDVIRISPASDVNPIFLSCLLNSSIGKAAIQNIKISGTRERFPLTQFKIIKLPKPPLKEQNQMATIFKGFLDSIAAIEKQELSIKLMRSTLLQNLF